MTLPAGLYAHFQTSEGAFTAKLFEDEAPNTVANFAGLAEGSKEWRDPVKGTPMTRPFYDGLIFHRVIDGMGGPGYTFGDEFHPSRRHTKAGVLSMANAGAGTNGSQFFITLGPTPHLDDRHSVFGEVISGMEVISRIGKMPTGRGDRPVKDVVIEAIKIERVPAAT